MSNLQVVVDDDDVLLREGLASLLDRSGFVVAGQAGDATELLTLTRERRSQLVILDIPCRRRSARRDWTPPG